MPALSRAMGVDELIGINQAIVASLTPEEMTIGFSFMLPAMNIEDRTELLGGMKAGAPPEVFAGVWAWCSRCCSPRTTPRLRRGWTSPPEIRRIHGDEHRDDVDRSRCSCTSVPGLRLCCAPT